MGLQMRLILGIALFVSLVLAGLTAETSAQTTVPCSPSTCTLTLERIVQTNDWGTTFVNDTVRVSTTGPATYLDLGVPSPVAKKMGSLSVTDSQGMALRAIPLPEDIIRGYLPIRVELPGRIGNYSIVLKSAFSGLLSFNGTTSRYTLTYSPFAIVDGNVTVTYASLNVKIGDWTSIIPSGINGTSPSGTFQTSTSSLSKYNTTLGKLSFASATQSNLDVTASRVITISQSTSAHVTDAYNVTNMGRDIPSLSFLLPKGITSTSGSDIIGRLDETKLRITAQDNGTQVTFTPRFGTIRAGGGANLKLDYELQSGVHITTSSLGEYSLNFRMLDSVKFVQPNLQTRILFPAGFKAESLTGPPATFSSNQIVLEASGISPLSDLSFSLSYRLDPFWASLSPLVWIGLIEGTLGASVLVLGVSSAKAETGGITPSSLIGRLVDRFDEKATLRLELEKLEEDMSRGALPRHDFKRRRRMIEIRILEIDRQISPLKQELTSSSQRYADLVRRIELAEAELQAVRSSMSDLRNQYRNGRISKESYESLNSDLIRRKEKAQQSSDSIVIGLREETR